MQSRGTKTGRTSSGLFESRHSRRDFLLMGGGVLAGTALAACGTSNPSSTSSTSTTNPEALAHFTSRPDLTAPRIDVTTGAGTPAAGFVCLTPAGPLMVDDMGKPVWIHPVPHASANLRVQHYQGQQVLSWWQGEVAQYGVGLSGEYVMMDGSYRQLMTVQARNGLPADLHEFIISAEGIAYFTAYRTYSTDLRSVGGPATGRALDATIQGVDLATGVLVFDWSSSAHIGFTESYETYAQDAPYDPVHVNSIDFTPDGKLLVSARNTWAIYKVDPATGAIIWRLGGKKTDFDLGTGARFAWQHDARTHADGTISLFDDEADPAEAAQSRGLVLDVDETAKTATVRAQYRHPGKRLLAGSQGSFQILPGGGVMIGWGADPYYTELQADGTLVVDGKLEQGTSYRAFRFDWIGRPSDLPAIATRTRGGRRSIFASWNGSTETVRWRLLAGPAADTLQPITDTARDGFETEIFVPSGPSEVAVAALDVTGAVLAQSPTLSL